jgi:hypothetical protein
MEQILNGTDFEFEQFWKWTVLNLNSFKSEQFRIWTVSNWNIFELEHFWIGTFSNLKHQQLTNEKTAYKRIHRKKAYEQIGPAHQDPASASTP